MIKFLYLILSLFLLFSFSAQNSGKGIYGISRYTQKQAAANQKTNLTFKFFGPDGKPVRARVKIAMNRDTTTVLLNDGVYKSTVEPGEYSFSFFIPFCRRVVTDSFAFKMNESIEICVHGVAMEMKMPEVQYDLGKPVIYLYPEKKTMVDVFLKIKGDLTFSYPEYKNGWKVNAYPEGNLEHNGKKYSYLFWEGAKNFSASRIDWLNGFVVKADSLISFFEHALYKSGLNEREMQDFITFWVPKMQGNKYNYIHFLFNNDCDYISEINIQPKPRNLIRVYMLWWPEEKNISVMPQQFPEFKRKGFTAVEWGGTELSGLNKEL